MKQVEQHYPIAGFWRDGIYHPGAIDLMPVSEDTVQRLMKTRQLRFVRVGRRVLIPASAITEYLADNTKAAHTGPARRLKVLDTAS